MEVRVQKKKNKFPIDGKKLHTVWKVLAVILSICVLAGGIALWNRQEPALAASYNMEIDPVTKKPIFTVVEVVPVKSLAVMNLFIEGEEEKTISMEKLEEQMPKTQGGEIPWWAVNFVYWEGKSGSKGNEPFSLIYEDGKRKIINNEIFRLYMLGNAKYDTNKSVYQNYLDNKKVLEEFNKNYLIKYQIVTPSELDTMNFDTVNYIQIGAGTQISEHANFYQYVGNAGNAPWHQAFKDDMKWTTALDLYNRVLAKNPRISISISSYSIVESGIGIDTNMYRLYQMLNYFDDPSVFKTLLKEDKDKPYPYISLETGIIHYSQYDSHTQWDDNLNRIAGDNPHVSASGHRELNYIPEEYDNILIYNQSAGYFDQPISAEAINKILQPSGGNPPEEPEDGTVKVLEIEPSNSYWLSGPGHLAKLATAIDVDEDDISVTYVTPNILNGMTVDLAAEYDLILVGDDTSLFNPAGAYVKKVRYRNNGYIEDAVIPQTLVNGLLAKDYTTKEMFNANISIKKPGTTLNMGSYPITISSSTTWNPGLRKQWSSIPNYYVLKNVELSLELQKLGANETVSSARFSGNDISAYMQRQLADFVKSGQPVIVADTLLVDAEKQINDFTMVDMNHFEDNQERDLDVRLFFALYGIADEKEYYDKAPDKSEFNKLISMRTGLEQATGKTVELKKDYKASIDIKDTQLNKDENDNVIASIAKKGWNSDTRPELKTLAKSNTLTFDYEIELPQGDKIENIVMTIVIDRNGDGIFDEAGDGTSNSGKPGTQNNATESIKNDQVFTYRFGEVSPDTYTIESGKITGRYIAPAPVESIEEVCQFQVKVSTIDKNNPLYGVWTGYMRPNLKKKEVKVLQITPYSESEGGKSLLNNKQFKDTIIEAEAFGEYQFNFENGFTSITEGLFSAECESGSITAESLKRDYDLIILGTDFNQTLTEEQADLDFVKAAEVLKKYSDELKAPIIITNDAFSYVNSENYFTPEEKNYYYKDLTLERAEYYKKNNQLTTEGGQLKKVKISENEYIGQKKKNEEAIDDKNYGEGTVYLEPENGKLYQDVIKNGTFKAIVRPVIEASGTSKSVYVGRRVWFFGYTYEGNRVVPDVGNASIELTPEDLYKALGKSMIDRSQFIIWTWYYANEDFVTEEELRAWYEEYDSTTGGVKAKTVNMNGRTFKYKDIHASLSDDITVDKKYVDTEHPIQIAGDTYYYYQYNDQDKFLARMVEADEVEKYGYRWQEKVQGDTDNPVESKYELNDVAGTGSSINPSYNAWNYLFTQMLRYASGMDRFAITTDIKPKDKRDKGSSRRWTEIEELQGFTNGALLEYAFLPKEGSSYASLVNTASPYNTQLSLNLALGVKPRTEYIEPLNEGQIGLYPFKISDEISEAKVKIAKNHAPYYQLDLERELGKGKIDDVTVWYTFAGSGKDDESKYFDTTVRDARNNYYLYSKGKIYYTGFSLYDVTEGTESEDAQLVPDMEMKLFINTIYAALNSETEETTCYDTVVREGGTVSGIELAQDAGVPNRYTCYYDEYDETLELSFRVQKISAADGETTPLTIGKKGEKGENGLPAVNEFNETVYTLTGIPEENGVSNFPVVKIAGEQGTKGSMGSGASDIWYTLRFTWDNGEGKIPDDIDGMTMIIGPKTAETGALRQDCIYAEIRFVKRNLFELD